MWTRVPFVGGDANGLELKLVAPGLEETYGPVAVNRVASVGDLANGGGVDGS